VGAAPRINEKTRYNMRWSRSRTVVNLTGLRAPVITTAMKAAHRIRVALRPSIKEGLRMTTRVETSGAAAERGTSRTLLYTLISKPSTTDKPQKAQIHHNSRLGEAEVVLAKSTLKFSNRNELKTNSKLVVSTPNSKLVLKVAPSVILSL
jgi:hypothetical protein